MNGPGVYSLGDFTVTTPATQISDVVDGLDGVGAITVQVRMSYGSGGTLANVYIQTSLDQGVLWTDIANVLLGTASEVAIINLSGMTPRTTQVSPTDGALANDTCVDGVLGDRFRTKVISAGTYAGQTQVSTRLVAR